MTPDHEARVVVACERCGLAYGSPGWVDVVIPDAIWNSLNASLLCFTCMTRALVAAGHENVPVVVASSPYKDANEEWRLIGWEHGRKVGGREVWEEAVKLAEDEMVDADDTKQESDYAYNSACRDIGNACRQRAAQVGGEG